MTDKQPAHLGDPWHAVHNQQPPEPSFYVTGVVELGALGVTAVLEESTDVVIPETLALRVSLKPLTSEHEAASEGRSLPIKQEVRYERRPYHGFYTKVLVTTSWNDERREIPVEIVQ